MFTHIDPGVFVMKISPKAFDHMVKQRSNEFTRSPIQLLCVQHKLATDVFSTIAVSWIIRDASAVKARCSIPHAYKYSFDWHYSVVAKRFSAVSVRWRSVLPLCCHNLNHTYADIGIRWKHKLSNSVLQLVVSNDGDRSIFANWRYELWYMKCT